MLPKKFTDEHADPTPLEIALDAVTLHGQNIDLASTASERAIAILVEEGGLKDIEARKLYGLVYRLVHEMLNDAASKSSDQ